jgi:hypothetical protein
MPVKLSSGLSFAIVLLSGAAPLLAHHAFGGEFDANRPVLLRGQVTKVEWVNPHAWIHVAVKCDGQQKTDQIVCAGKAAGATEEWMVEGGTPNTLLRRGITRQSLTAGTEVVVDGYQTRDHTLTRANGRNITFPDGRKLFLGSSGTGAPRDGADPSEAGKK